MACRLFITKPLTELMLAYCQLESWVQISMKFESEFYHFHSRKCIWKCSLSNWRLFFPRGDELIQWRWAGNGEEETLIDNECWRNDLTTDMWIPWQEKWYIVGLTQMALSLLVAELYHTLQITHRRIMSDVWLQWRHNERDGVSHHQRLDYLLSRLFMRRSKEKSKLRVTGLCEGNSPVTGEFPAQRASNMKNVSIWWRHHVIHAD